jgi:hypothetical protein
MFVLIRSYTEPDTFEVWMKCGRHLQPIMDQLWFVAVSLMMVALALSGFLVYKQSWAIAQATICGVVTLVIVYIAIWADGLSNIAQDSCARAFRARFCEQASGALRNEYTHAYRRAQPPARSK